MRILFLTHYYPPEVNAPASRTAEHSRVWTKLGHRVSVVTCVPNHPHGRLYPGFRNRLFQKESCDGVTVYRVLTYLTANRGVFRRTLNFLLYFSMTTIAAPFLPRVDVVVSTSPQFFCGLSGYLVSRIKRVPWVLEIRDLWPESIVAVGALRPGRVLRVLQWLAAFAYRKADRIITVTESFGPYLVAQGASEDKITVIRNGVDLELFTPDVATDHFAAEHHLVDKFVVAYVGTHGMAHGLETILQAADLLRDRRDIVFMMVGDGAQREHIASLRTDMQLDNVLMLPQQQKDKMPDVWHASSVSLVLLRNEPVFESVIPSKLFESLAMTVPVILGVRGESRQLLEASGGGLCIEPEHAGELAQCVETLADDPARCQALGNAGRRYVEQHFDRRQLAAQYAAVLADLLSPEPD